MIEMCWCHCTSSVSLRGLLEGLSVPCMAANLPGAGIAVEAGRLGLGVAVYSSRELPGQWGYAPMQVMQETPAGSSGWNSFAPSVPGRAERTALAGFARFHAFEMPRGSRHVGSS